MVMPFSAREIRVILAWKNKHLWPDEARVLHRLQSALDSGEPVHLSLLQVRLVREWAEEELGSHFGGGKVVNSEQRAILTKLDAALST